MTEMCACGKPLHYSDPAKQAEVEEFIQLVKKPNVLVYVREGGMLRYFIVQRHYIALHGLTGSDLLTGAVPGAIEVTTENPQAKAFEEYDIVK